MCILKSFNVIHCRFPSFMCECWKVLSYLLLSEKVIFAQCDCNFSMHFIPSIGNSAINIMLCASIFSCKRFLMDFFHNLQYHPLLSLDNLKVLHKFRCIVKYHLQWFYKCEKIRRWSVSSSILNLMIFDLNAFVSSFSVKRAHNLFGSFFRWLFFLCRLRL